MTEYYFNELFPSALMFGMSSKEFWEEDPQLYWAYRIFYLKQKEMEQKEKMEYIKYNSWLQGNMNCMATSIALSNGFSKQKTEYPEYDKVFTNEKKTKKKLTKNEVNMKVQEEFNAWARY